MYKYYSVIRPISIGTMARMSYLLYAKKQEGLIWHTNCVLTRKNVRIF